MRTPALCAWGMLPPVFSQASRRWCLACCALTLTGCFRVSFVDHAAEAKVPPGARVQERGFWQHKFALGLINAGEDIDARDVCGAPPVRVQTAGDILTTAVSFVTLFVYTPRKVYITCPEREQ